MADAHPAASHEALRRPSKLTADPAERQRAVATAGNLASRILTEVVTGPGNTPADRVAAAVFLRTLSDTANDAPVLDPGIVQDPSALDLTWSPDLHPAARQVFSEPVIMALLTWASSANPGEPPVRAARAAAQLRVDDDGAIYQKVSQRAVQVAEQRNTTRMRKNELREFTETLGRADQAARDSRDSDREQDVPGDAPAGWSDHDDRALEDLLGRGQPPAQPTQDPSTAPPTPSAPEPPATPPESAPPTPEPAGDGSPVGFNQPQDTGRFEDPWWSEPHSQNQDPPGPGPRRAYDPRALFDGPMSPAQRADEKNVLRNWAITAGVLLVLLVLVGLLL
ncbi:MAG: hypothetical protein Q4C81_10145 [Kocuria sp.]|nr:hypothetical protein [Kocuria sp.]